MNGNGESTASTDSSFTTDESSNEEDDSLISETLPNNKSLDTQIGNQNSTPQCNISKSIKSFSSERKLSNANNENVIISHQGRRINESQSSCKSVPETPIDDVSPEKIKSNEVLLPLNTNSNTLQSDPLSTHKRTPEIFKSQNNMGNERVATPIIKSGIRKFTQGSAKHRQKQALQNRYKVKCQLFSQKQVDPPPLDPPVPMSVPVTTSVPETLIDGVSPEKIKSNEVLLPLNTNSNTLQSDPLSTHKRTPEIFKSQNNMGNERVATPIIKSGIRKFTQGSAKHRQKQALQNRYKVKCQLFSQKQVDPPPLDPPVPMPVPVTTSVPETPINEKPMSASSSSSHVATPSYPQGVIGNNGTNNSEKVFRTIRIRDKKYVLFKKLGTGGSSVVYKGVEPGTSCEYAVKCVNLAIGHDMAQGYINELRLLRELQNSDRVIKLYGYGYDRENRQILNILLEAGETDLSSFLQARGTGLPPALVLQYWEEMLLAVHYIHENGVIHADLKPANFLLVCGRLKLIDFGIASAISGDATSVVQAQAVRTFSYVSPEALMGGAGGYNNRANIQISFKSDVWSLGCILYSMVYGRTPFGHIPNLAKLAAILLNPNHRIEYSPAEHLPSSLISALKCCLTYDSRARPSVRELLAMRHVHPHGRPLPDHLIDKVKAHVSPEEFQLFQQARL